MKTNENHINFNKGYQSGYNDAKEEAFWPKIIGIGLILLISWVSPLTSLIVFFVYAVFAWTEYRDRKKYSHNVEVPPMVIEEE